MEEQRSKRRRFKAVKVFGFGTKKSLPSPKTESFHLQRSMTGLENFRVSEGLDFGHCNERRWMLPVLVLELSDALPYVANVDAFSAVVTVVYFETALSLNLLPLTATLGHFHVLPPGPAIEVDVSFGPNLFEIWKSKLKVFTMTEKGRMTMKMRITHKCCRICMVTLLATVPASHENDATTRTVLGVL
jgi:hypothetical protein